MPRTLMLLASLLFAAPAFAAGTVTSEDMKHLYEYGDALYYAYQGEWFGALARIDAAQIAQTGEFDASAAGVPSSATGHLEGDIELSYRMDHRAGRAIEAVIESTANDERRNEAIFRLARMYFQKDQPENALRAVERIRGDVPRDIRPDLAFLRANIFMANGRNAAAVSILRELQGEKKLEGFSSYNLGIAMLRAGDEPGGREFLDRAGRTKSDDRAVQAIRDKANLVLGEQLLGENNFAIAKEVLDRIRLTGPFSNRALLSSGWADASQDQYESALVPWSILVERDVIDPAVQEAMLAIPFAYGRLGVYSTAALKYEVALKAFGREIGKLDASIESIRGGAFLKGLVRDELKQDADLVGSLRKLPETPETAYLLDLMASHDFQESLQNYLDLGELLTKLDAWTVDLAAFEDIIRLRRAHYTPLLPAIDREFRLLDVERRRQTEQRDRLAKQLEDMQDDPQPDLLITSEERKIMEQLTFLENLVTPSTKEVAPGYLDRLRRLRGVLHWNIHTEYDKRYAAARAHLGDLDEALERLNRRFQDYAVARQTAIESYEGYDDVIRRERQRIASARKKIQATLEHQGKVLEIMATNELTRRRDRLEELRVKARFALADSYDRARKSQGEKKSAQ